MTTIAWDGRTLAAGKTAHEAIEITSTLDPSTGNGIDTLTLGAP